MIVERDLADHIDMNFGSPVPKVTRRGGGAALPYKRRLFERIVRAAVDNAGQIPVTVKMRIGIDHEHRTHLDAGRIAAVAMVAGTGCDGVVVGRGCLGRPWLFGDLEAAFAGRPAPTPPTLGQVAVTLRRHAELLGDHMGPNKG